MNIIISFDKNKYSIMTQNFESINSIINNFLEIHNIDINIEDYFLDYNGQYLNGNYSLEKYNILENSNLTLNKKIRGGNSFFSFISKNPVLVVFSLIIAIIPIFILPTGFIPSLASLLNVIIKKSFDTISKYLICILGKKTLVSRFHFVLVIIKYVIFFLMIYVVITFPLILLCCTIKGFSIYENPLSMCDPLKTANNAGTILTIIYIFIYGFYRLGDQFLEFFINIFDKVYILSTIFNPLLKAILNIYNKFKYIPLISIPIIGQGIASYFLFLTAVPEAVELVLSTVIQLGCGSGFNINSFKNLLSKKINKTNNIDITNNNYSYDKSGGNKTILPKMNDYDICAKDIIQCCSPNNFIQVGDALSSFLESPIIANLLKSKSLYSSFMLFTQGFYENALINISSGTEIPNEMNKKIKFFKSILNDNSYQLSNHTINLINTFLSTLNIDLIPEIKTQIDSEIPTNEDKIEMLQSKIYNLEQTMVEYSQENGLAYTPGKTILKSILKNVFMNTFCNVTETAKTTNDVIHQMGDVENISDMLKAGSSSGIITSFSYLITVIILIIMGIFNKF